MKRVVVQTTNYVSRTSSRNACIRRPHLVCTLYLYKGYQVMKIQGVIEAFLDNFEASIVIYASKLIKTPYISTLKN